jgi:hypothetical protein
MPAKGCGGSVWESNLLFTDSSSTYEEALGLSWKDLASFGTLPGWWGNLNTAPYLRNIEEGKKEKKSWYQYVFLGVARENETC